MKSFEQMEPKPKLFLNILDIIADEGGELFSENLSFSLYQFEIKKTNFFKMLWPIIYNLVYSLVLFGATFWLN